MSEYERQRFISNIVRSPIAAIEYTETSQKGRPRKRKYNVPNIENVDAAKDSYKFGMISQLKFKN